MNKRRVKLLIDVLDKGMQCYNGILINECDNFITIDDCKSGIIKFNKKYIISIQDLN